MYVTSTDFDYSVYAHRFTCSQRLYIIGVSSFFFTISVHDEDCFLNECAHKIRCLRFQ